MLFRISVSRQQPKCENCCWCSPTFTHLDHSYSHTRSPSCNNSNSEASPLLARPGISAHGPFVSPLSPHCLSPSLFAICLYGRWQLMWQIASRPPLSWYLCSRHNLHFLFDDNHLVATTDHVHQPSGFTVWHQYPPAATINHRVRFTATVCVMQWNHATLWRENPRAISSWILRAWF